MQTTFTTVPITTTITHNGEVFQITMCVRTDMYDNRLIHTPIVTEFHKEINLVRPREHHTPTKASMRKKYKRSYPVPTQQVPTVDVTTEPIEVTSVQVPTIQELIDSEESGGIQVLCAGVQALSLSTAPVLVKPKKKWTRVSVLNDSTIIALMKSYIVTSSPLFLDVLSKCIGKQRMLLRWITMKEEYKSMFIDSGTCEYLEHIMCDMGNTTLTKDMRRSIMSLTCHNEFFVLQ